MDAGRDGNSEPRFLCGADRLLSPVRFTRADGLQRIHVYLESAATDACLISRTWDNVLVSAGSHARGDENNQT
jgi:hypothetical protein